MGCSDDNGDEESATPAATGGADNSGGDPGATGTATGGSPTGAATGGAAQNGTGGAAETETGGTTATGAECEPFEACGGDPIGSWRFVGICFLPEPLPACPELSVTGTGTVHGTYDVSASQTTASLTQSAEFTVTLPKSCLDGMACDEAFANYGERIGAEAIATETNDSCVVAISHPPVESSATRSIEIDGATFTDGVSRETEFCQNGSQLRIRALDDNPFGIVYTLER